MKHSDAIAEDVRQRVADLEHFHGHITGCHVVVEAPHHRHRQGTLYSVHIDLTVPGAELVVSRVRRRDHSHEDVYVALRDAFGAAARQLEDNLRVRRGKVKRREEAAHGRVSRLFPAEGYGFVEMADGSHVYFHENSVAGGAFDTLEVGVEVRLVLADVEGEEGPQASAIVPLGKQAVGYASPIESDVADAHGR
jgi:cold shock CspA family protein